MESKKAIRMWPNKDWLSHSSWLHFIIATLIWILTRVNESPWQNVFCLILFFFSAAVRVRQNLQASSSEWVVVLHHIQYHLNPHSCLWPTTLVRSARLQISLPFIIKKIRISGCQMWSLRHRQAGSSLQHRHLSCHQRCLAESLQILFWFYRLKKSINCWHSLHEPQSISAKKSSTINCVNWSINSPKIWNLKWSLLKL